MSKSSTNLPAQDGLAFAAAVGFTLSLYSSIVSLFPVLEPARPALLTAGIAFAVLMFGRIARAQPISWDGGRGLALIGLCAWTALSYRWSFNPPATREQALELAKLAGIYLTLVNVITTRRRLAIVLAVAVLASLAPSIGAVNRWRDGIDLLDGYRARWLGVYLDPNHLAMSLVAVVPIAVALLLHSRSWALRIASAAAGGLAVAAIVLTHSRGGAVGLLIAMVLWALSAAEKIKALALTAAMAMALAVFAPSSFWTRTESIAAYEEDASAQGRVWAWEVAAAINQDRPLTGAGGGAFRFAWPHYAPPEARGIALVAHNVFLAQLGELGWVGLLLFVAFVSSCLAGAFAASGDGRAGPLARAVAAGFAGYIVCSMLSGYVLSAHFFLLAALAAASQRALAPANDPLAHPSLPAAGSAPV